MQGPILQYASFSFPNAAPSPLSASGAHLPSLLTAVCCVEQSQHFHCDVLFQSKSIFLILLLTLLLLLLGSLFFYIKRRYCCHSNPQFPDIIVDNKSCDARLYSFGTAVCRLNTKFHPTTWASAIPLSVQTLKHGVATLKKGSAIQFVESATPTGL